MPHLKYTTSKGASPLWVAAVVLYATAALAQSAKDGCGPTQVIPLIGAEPPAKIITYPPLAEPLASRGVAIIYYCVQNLHLVPVFGPNALAVSPRVGHLHVTVDDASWVWADASGNPIILMGLLPGPHKVLIELADANHRIRPKLGHVCRSRKECGQKADEIVALPAQSERLWNASEERRWKIFKNDRN